MSKFDLSMTYQLTSDVPLGYVSGSPASRYFESTKLSFAVSWSAREGGGGGEGGGGLLEVAEAFCFARPPWEGYHGEHGMEGRRGASSVMALVVSVVFGKRALVGLGGFVYGGGEALLRWRLSAGGGLWPGSGYTGQRVLLRGDARY